MKRFALLSAVVFFLLSPLLMQRGERLKIAASSAPHAQLLEYMRADLERKGVLLDIITIDDYNTPNRALADGAVDANFFQHTPFLSEQKKSFGYKISPLARVHLEPLALYSKRHKELGSGRYAIPNDPSNRDRALKFIDSLNVSQVIEVDSSMLPRLLEDVDYAVIPGNMAMLAQLIPSRDALLIESSDDSPYANVIVIRDADVDREDLHQLKEAMNSESLRDYIYYRYQGEIIPAF